MEPFCSEPEAGFLRWPEPMAVNLRDVGEVEPVPAVQRLDRRLPLHEGPLPSDWLRVGVVDAC